MPLQPPEYMLDTAFLADMLRAGVEANKRPRLTIVSESMTPLLQVGDQVELEMVQPDNLRPGDIVVLEESHGMLTHRYWQTMEHSGEKYLVTRGDRPLAYDQPRPADDLIGRVVGRVRDGKSLPLDSGKGKRLNKRLGRMGKFENRQFANGKQPLDWDMLSTPDGRVLGQQWQRSGQRFTLRICCWILKQYARLLTIVLGRS